MADELKEEHTSQDSHVLSVEEIRAMVSDIKVAMLTTSDAAGRMHSRPMYTQETEFDGDLWFFTSRKSSLVTELGQNPAVLVQYSNPKSQRFVVISGRGRVIVDPAKVNELWNPTLKMWFEGGPRDPDIALVNVESHQAEYWDSPAAPVRWVQFLSGVVTGKRPPGDSHGSVPLG